jgi:hypothetical protein
MTWSLLFCAAYILLYHRLISSSRA